MRPGRRHLTRVSGSRLAASASALRVASASALRVASASALRVVSASAVLMAAANPVEAQQAQPRIAVADVALSADTVLLGDRFSLTVTLRLAEGSVAFLPDSILGRGFEPFGAVECSRGR